MNGLRLLSIALTLLSILSGASAQIPVGTWRDHLPYNNAKAVVAANNKVYCATDWAVFYYDTEDLSLNRLTKITGLSDLETGDIAFSNKHDKLIIGYKNGNIDLISESSKTNIPDIKIKNVIATKAINDIYIADNFAYLSCGFGIVVLNLLKNEISDTYIIGLNGAFLNINETIIYNDSIYALTDNGLYKADIANPFLANFENWILDTNSVFRTDNFFASTVFNGKLYTVNNTETGDTCYVNQQSESLWSIVINNFKNIQSIGSNKDNLFIVTPKTIYFYDTNLSLIKSIATSDAKEIISYNNCYWIADNKEGLIKYNEANEYSYYNPNGPKSITSFELYDNGGEMLIAPGGHRYTGENLWHHADVYQYYNNWWENLSDQNASQLKSFRDVVSFTSHEQPGSYYAATWGYGIIEVTNNEISNYFTAKNTDSVLSNYVSGLAYDEAGNLWAVCRGSNFPFVVKTKDNKWYKYDYDGLWSKVQTHKMIATHTGNFWTISEKDDQDIYVWNGNNTPENGNDDLYNSFKLMDEFGARLSSTLNDIVEDVEGDIWIATAEGVVVYDEPERAATDTLYARKPQLVIDGYLKNLLENENVTCIAVDGGNRKWFGTSSGGVFLVSADGTKQIINWSTSNSKLFSNTITDIEINQKNGEVFIATEKGVQSYMGTSSENKPDYSNVFAFPNPVRKDYNGYISIRGLMYQTDVKITDLSGRLVFETQSNGGDALWNGKDLTGNPVASGIYLVLCTNADGSETEATKILIIK
ncbi:MAG: T9SS type A sorting domain-containing protein [Salinivirgaceae bacterium]|nr:T9SS type A sorting domain-containing protein [Salinivirgaceae bacterium]